MKKINRSVNKMPITASIILLLLLSFGFSSCLKNSAYNYPIASAAASVDLPLAAANNNSVVSFSYTNVLSASIPFYINLAAPKTLGTAVTATFGIDSVFLNNYNTANATNFALMPDSDYVVLNGWNRSIPAGQRLDSMYVKFDFTKMDLTQTYCLPITITQASVPIEQWNHLLISVSVRNKYDGEYTLVIGQTGWGAYGIQDGPPSYTWGTVGVVTQGPASFTYDNVLFPGIVSGGGATQFGATDAQFTMDPNTNLLVSVVNLTPNDGRGRQFAIDPSVPDSRWDPATGNMYLALLFNQNGRPTMYVRDTLIFQGPRP